MPGLLTICPNTSVANATSILVHGFHQWHSMIQWESRKLCVLWGRAMLRKYVANATCFVDMVLQEGAALQPTTSDAYLPFGGGARLCVGRPFANQVHVWVEL